MAKEIAPVDFSAEGPPRFMDDESSAPLPFAKLMEGKPFGAEHEYYARNENGVVVKAGIWRSEPYVECYDSYPCDEFMHILRGRVAVEWNGKSRQYKEGDCFLLPKGFCGCWRQPVAMVKYYITVA